MDDPRIRAHAAVAALFLLAACPSPSNPSPTEKDSPAEAAAESRLAQLSNEDVEIIEIEGCEYIVYSHAPSVNQGFGYMAHKGNCSNPIHVCGNSTSAGDPQRAEGAAPRDHDQ